MRNRFDSSFFSSVVRIVLGYALGRALYGLGRSPFRWLVILFILGLLGILTAIVYCWKLLGPK